MSDKLLRTSEASRMLGITDVYLYRLAKAKEIKSVRIGKRGLRFSESDIKNWIEKRKK